MRAVFGLRPDAAGSVLVCGARLRPEATGASNSTRLEPVGASAAARLEAKKVFAAIRLGAAGAFAAMRPET
eukprot:7973015-Lingulodinium_polyedra.AAC.1